VDFTQFIHFRASVPYFFWWPLATHCRDKQAIFAWEAGRPPCHANPTHSKLKAEVPHGTPPNNSAATNERTDSARRVVLLAASAVGAKLLVAG
jgi:hypothetical protein